MYFLFYVFRKRGIDDPYNVNMSALGTAVDVMSFAQDIVVDTKTNLPCNPQTKKENQMSITYNANETSKIFKDPLRELVLISEAIAIPDANYISNAKTLANAASVLDNVKEIHVGLGISAKHPIPSAKSSSKPPSAASITQASSTTAKTTIVPNLTASNIFQNPNEIIDPEKEKDFLLKLEQLEDTDDDLMGEKPVLGKISLMRRAKSAVSRTSSGKKKTDEHPLFKIAWDEDFIKDDKSSIPIDEIGKENLGFLNDEAEEDEIIVSVEEVRREMALFHLQHKSSSESDSPKGTKKSSTKKGTMNGHSKKSEQNDNQDDNNKDETNGKTNGKFSKSRRPLTKSSKNK